MSTGIGLGLERLGLWTIRFPRLFALFLLVFTGGLMMALPGLRFQGDILAQIDEGGPLWREYETLSEDFAFASPDIYVVFEAPGAGDDLSQWLSRQSRLVLDLRLTPGVGDVQSLFSLREIEGDGMAPLFDPQTDSLTPGELVQIADRRPDVALFLDASGPVSQMAIAMDRQTASQASRSDRLVAEVERLVQASGLSAHLAGRAVMQRDMSRTLLSDLLRMVVLSIVVGWAVGFLIFTDIRAVIVTNVVSPIAMVWTAGFAALTGQALDPLSVILPLLASIIAFADAVHLVVPLQRRLADAPSPRMATRDIVQEIGPATALTSMTTALAFGSLALAGGEMTRIAGLGVAAVILAWIAVMTVTPLLCLALAGETATHFGSGHRPMPVRGSGLHCRHEPLHARPDRARRPERGTRNGWRCPVRTLRAKSRRGCSSWTRTRPDWHPRPRAVRSGRSAPTRMHPAATHSRSRQNRSFPRGQVAAPGVPRYPSPSLRPGRRRPVRGLARIPDRSQAPRPIRPARLYPSFALQHARWP